MQSLSRREFVQRAASGLASAAAMPSLLAQLSGERPSPANGVSLLNPRDRVPLSFIIDDSTCLVNLAHFGIPQFAQVFPDRYRQPWQSLPREIPDAFVRKFAGWCQDHHVKGKYSVVPYPACVGWIDREMPGSSRQELEASLHLIRTQMTPDWDIHPEMVTHTWVIDTKTGRPYEERSEQFMENWAWTDGKSVDQLADYLAYALRILKNVGLPCEGITTPGGFGNRVLPELAQATLEACRAVYQAEIPHYFRHLFTDDRSVAPRVEYAAGLDTDDPRCVVSIIGCTGDWFGGWDGLEPGSSDQFITEDGRGGRLPEVISRGEPAILVGHWPGIYFNGEETGFNIFQTVVHRLHATYDHLLWMKLSEISRYWAARELTRIDVQPETLLFQAPYACPAFTLHCARSVRQPPVLTREAQRTMLREVSGRRRLESGTWTREETGFVACLDLPRGESRLSFG